jgi:hypothetical protein
LEFYRCNKKDGIPPKIVVVNGPVLDPRGFMDRYELGQSAQQGNIVIEGDFNVKVVLRPPHFFNNGPVNKSRIRIEPKFSSCGVVRVLGILGLLTLRLLL